MKSQDQPTARIPQQVAPSRIPSVSIFSSSRLSPEHRYYALTERIARVLSDAEEDVELFSFVDHPHEVLEMIFRYYEHSDSSHPRKKRKPS
ncbi:MAG: hypothetical protein ACE5LB_12870 [Acidiferrobacterales bacterium]